MQEQHTQQSAGYQRITIGFTAEMFAWLKATARAEHRTVADQLRYLVDLEQQRRQAAGNSTPR